MRHDDSLLLDMLVAARKAKKFVEGIAYEEFEKSDLHQNAVLKVLEVIGEAASRISTSTKDKHPEIQWSQIVGLRNRIVHAYFTIDIELVWNIVKDDVPALLTELEGIAPPEAD
ncbi:MAG: DUF86 domain-containing protein [Gammaproteobacteria bacterium]|nr:DUF86 domain-containing protein [Gammaproteobacteria bacterium]